MGEIDFRRAYFAGLAAASVGTALSVLAFILAFQLEAYYTIRVVLVDPSLRVPVLLLHMFIGGPFAVWFYAALKPRFGSGIKNALVASTSLWFVAVPYEWTMMSFSGVLVQIRVPVLVATYAGSWFLITGMMLIGAYYYDQQRTVAVEENGAES
ncbi:MAG TPA: hypothetical protein VMU24_03180 [Candidatus Acidoferrales bacterium]|nr:hypothetical protein [Candidatus Acidoferrales bacterium]